MEWHCCENPVRSTPMKKNPASRSGLFSFRILLALSLCSVSVLLVFFAQAGTVRISARKAQAQGAAEFAVPTEPTVPTAPTNTTITVNSTFPVIVVLVGAVGTVG